MAGRENRAKKRHFFAGCKRKEGGCDKKVYQNESGTPTREPRSWLLVLYCCSVLKLLVKGTHRTKGELGQESPQQQQPKVKVNSGRFYQHC